MADAPSSPRKPVGSRSRITGPRVATLIVAWLVLATLVAPALGLYYEDRASLYLVPPLVLIYAYCLSHRRRIAALLALIVTLFVVLAVGLALIMPKATAALAP